LNVTLFSSSRVVIRVPPGVKANNAEAVGLPEIYAVLIFVQTESGCSAQSYGRV
jgi:hypothetical protein